MLQFLNAWHCNGSAQKARTVKDHHPSLREEANLYHQKQLSESCLQTCEVSPELTFAGRAHKGPRGPTHTLLQITPSYKTVLLKGVVL